MNRIAYCVVHLDTTKSPPAVIGADIYSESAQSLTGAISPGRYAFDVCDMVGRDLEEAKTNLLESFKDPRMLRVYGWVVKLLEEAGHR